MADMPEAASPRRVGQEVRDRLREAAPFSIRLTPADLERIAAAYASASVLSDTPVEELLLQALADGLFMREHLRRGSTVLIRHADGRTEKVVPR